MSYVEPAIKLNFDDVLLKPKRSTLTSRASVDLNRTIPFDIPLKHLLAFLSWRRTWMELVHLKWQRCCRNSTV